MRFHLKIIQKNNFTDTTYNSLFFEQSFSHIKFISIDFFRCVLFLCHDMVRPQLLEHLMR